MKRILVAMLALSLAGSAASIQAQTPGRAGPPQPPPPATGEIRGTVVDAESSAPVGSPRWRCAAGRFALVSGAVARPDGFFRIEGLRPGSYFLRVSAIGYATQNTARSPSTRPRPARARAASGWPAAPSRWRGWK